MVKIFVAIILALFVVISGKGIRAEVGDSGGSGGGSSDGEASRGDSSSSGETDKLTPDSKCRLCRLCA